MTNLISLRQQIRAQRAKLTPEQIHKTAIAIKNIFTASPLFSSNQHIAGYFPCNGEVDTQLIAETIWQAGKNYYLPILHPANLPRLWFVLYRPDMLLIKNRFGIAEPVWHSADLLPAWALDVVLTPLVAFDKMGNRLGMGGGFYDRTFAFLRRNPKRAKPQLIGLAYEFQKVDQLQQNSWDIPLRAIITEQQFYSCENRS